MKKIVTFLALILFLALGTSTTLADENSLTYSLEEGGTESIEVESDEGDVYVISVEEIPQITLFSSKISIPNKGTYKISSALKNQWSLIYYVSIDSNFKITNANRLTLNILKGTLKNSTLTHTSNHAKATFNRKIGLITVPTTVTATISGKSLIVN